MLYDFSNRLRKIVLLAIIHVVWVKNRIVVQHDDRSIQTHARR